MAASQYAPCRIVEAEPPSTQRMPGAPSQPAPLTLRAPKNDVAAPTPAWQPHLYRAVPPPRPASPTPVEPIRAYRPAPEAAPSEVKRHDSWHPVEVPVDCEPARDSSMFPASGAPGAAQSRRSLVSSGWALAGLAAFAIVLGLLMVADRARQTHALAGQSAGPLGAPRATTELPSATTQPVAAKPARGPQVPTQEARGVDPSDLPISKGVDISTLPLVTDVSAAPYVPARPQAKAVAR